MPHCEARPHPIQTTGTEPDLVFPAPFLVLSFPFPRDILTWHIGRRAQGKQGGEEEVR